MSVDFESVAVTQDVQFRSARPEDAEAIAELYDHVYRGKYPIAECTDPVRIRRILEEGDYIWVIATADDLVVGSSVGKPEAANSSCELGRAAVRLDYTGRGNFARLFEETVERAKARPDNELIYGYARSERARYLFERVVYRMHWTGTDGGMHRVADTREEHLIGGAFNPDLDILRVVPRDSPVIAGSLIDQELSKMSARTVAGAYPAALVGRGPVDFVHESACGRIGYVAFESSRAIVVGELDTTDPRAARRLLSELVEHAPMPVEHVTLYALADKAALIAELCAPQPGEARFTACAYLAGWHRDGAARYDCVTLTLRLDQRRPVRLGFDERVRALHASLPVGYR